MMNVVFLSVRSNFCNVVCICFAVMLCQGSRAGAADWRSGWTNIKDEAHCDKLLKTAETLHFQALIANSSPQKMRVFSERAAAAGIELYYWLAPVTPKGSGKKFLQKLRPEEVAVFVRQSADKQKMEHGYQGGGEPLPEHTEVNFAPSACPDYPEVMVATKECIREYVESCPKLTGFALDMFGYQNYRDCVCEASEKAFQAWRIKHTDVPEKEARDTFSLEELVSWQNELCEYARSLRPGLKTTVHVWPVYLSQPLYGNRLDLDYCAQTAAWFFLPYWSDEKIATYSKTIVNDAQKFHHRQFGIPFVGLFVGRGLDGDKPLERFIHEVSVVFESTPSRSLSVYDFNSFVQHPEYTAALQELFRKYGVQ